ncbi:GMC family oxidoreductase N-terminal domain-containing protein [Gemmobacter fulvus]|uniref:GMC family oxidoreductase N-terminal domain-containing protein n=1 Tax=Gemmobacter fulvus TaxID=2840474 RepID=A0A975P974_9RHOB|nr:GMC family oxidoreductase N-terminal domain-containing protein [Gemmobacter fulvus]MBT9244445.1 GMC family oxidoreductase N-terminal domain-containing protein [Gemmobacter fulvus]QWK91318.1 GMC family oxidoreductase N-terminal domain-containing protein [Gemmobacter fulvus]
MDDSDYIIVGAGSAGCVLANRLSESGKYRVTLIEAGGSDRRFYVNLPLGYGKLFYDPAVNWLYKTEPDPGLAGQRDHWPRGRILGGSSSINAMVWIRGHAEDYAEWGQAATGWGWQDVLPAYRALEDNEAGADAWRGQGGPLFISANRKGLHPLVNNYIAACAEAGLPETADFNGAQQEGAGVYQMTIKGARRNSTARAFLRPAMKRPNLHVITQAQVTRVLFDGRRAVGVEYRQGGQTRTLRARGEVILSGGAINSPQLLQLSGIGPGALLQGLGIPVLHDNPNVGAHLSDHQGINYTWRMRVPTYNDALRPWWGKLWAGMHYVLGGGGPLAKSINHAGGFFRTSADQPRPNMQLYMQAFSTLLPREGERPILTPDPFPGLSIGLSNCRPTSRGHIRLRSADPLAHPVITANAFSTDHDVQEMLLAVKFLRRITAQPAMARVIAEELRPGPSVTQDADLIADFRQRSGTVYHPSCTCRMGQDAATTVLDPLLRVRGVTGLRVIDASSFPNLIAGNTNAPSILMGWMGADKILGAAP